MFLLAAAIVALAMIACGSLLARTRDVATSLVVGYPIFGTICFLVGLISINRITMAIVTIPLAIIGCFCVAPAILPALSRRSPAGLPALHTLVIVERTVHQVVRNTV